MLALRCWEKQEKNPGSPRPALVPRWLLWSPPHLTLNVSSNGKRGVSSTRVSRGPRQALLSEPGKPVGARSLARPLPGEGGAATSQGAP